MRLIAGAFPDTRTCSKPHYFGRTIALWGLYSDIDLENRTPVVHFSDDRVLQVEPALPPKKWYIRVGDDSIIRSARPRGSRLISTNHLPSADELWANVLLKKVPEAAPVLGQTKLTPNRALVRKLDFRMRVSESIVAAVLCLWTMARTTSNCAAMSAAPLSARSVRAFCAT
jgi:hypothetical protein